jgi:hypothetical protein
MAACFDDTALFDGVRNNAPNLFRQKGLNKLALH